MVADLRGFCYPPWVHRSTLRSTLRASAGLGTVEVLAVTVILGIAVIGVALMFGKGSAWVSATGLERVAAGLAQQRIEQIRDCGWEVATADPPEENCPGRLGEAPIRTGVGVLLPELVDTGDNRPFIRTVCIQYVDPSTPQGLTQPAFTFAACPAGAVTRMIRITVVVSSEQPETSDVVLQAWMHCREPRARCVSRGGQ